MKTQFAFLVFLLAFGAFALNAQQISGINYTAQQANTIIINATNYVNTVNQSGYLIFNPNLAQAYAYLNISDKAYQVSPNTAVLYAYKAESSANEAYNVISVYKYISIFPVVIFTIIMALLLYKYMKPINKKILGKKGRR